MSEFDLNKLRRLDLTTLLIFLGLVRTRKAAEVAAELGLTPSSISHALGRLRSVFEDELFLRRPHGLEPTAFALRIEPRLRLAVEATQDALEGGAPFVAATSQATVRLAAVDSALATLIPPVQRSLATEAPGVTLQALPIGRQDVEAALADGALDIALGVFPSHGASIVSTPLYRDDYLVSARADHPAMQSPMTMTDFLREKHLLVAPRGDATGVVDDALRDLGLTREVAMLLPQFLPAFAILEISDLIAVLPSRLVRQFAPRFGLAHQAPPLPLRAFAVSGVRHRRNAKNPLLLWLMDKLAAAAAV